MARKRRRGLLPRALGGALVSLIVYLAIGSSLVWLGAPGAREGPVASFADFDRLRTLDRSGLPDLRRSAARDGVGLAYWRYRPAKPSNRALIVRHGSAYHGKPLHPLARMISAAGSA